MKRELHMVDIFPKVVAAHKPAMLTLRILDSSYNLEEGTTYRIEVLPLTESAECTECQNYVTTCVAINNQITFTYNFRGEQEYYVRMLRNDGTRVVQMSVYALEDDLYGTCAYRGDLHVHSCFSDGRESPEFIAAEYRKYGFDFMAITDHRVMEPSLGVIEYYKDLPIDLRLFTGEEVHLADNHIHIVNFGSDISINTLFRDDPERYHAEVEAIAGTLSCPEGVNTFEYAACIWIYNKIRQNNGLGIYAHPHWLSDVYHVRDAMTWYQFRTHAFDAFELLGGQTSEENNMQLAIYNEARAEGLRIPIVGSSDSHSVLNGQWFTESQTLVFAKNTEKKALFDSIKAGLSVAVEAYHGEHQKVHGSYRMVSYALFLLHNYFPIHDQLCMLEGQAMHEYVKSNPDSAAKTRAVAMLKLLHGQIDELNERYFGVKRDLFRLK